MTNSRLIGLYSPAPQSGKSTVARYLSGHGYRILPVAGSLKKMIRILLLETDLTTTEIDHYMVSAKETPIPSVLGVSVRHLCQTLGHEWGRQCIHPELWVSLWQRQVQNNLTRGIDVVVDDIRFLNEAAALHALGGELWWIERPGVVRQTSHASEGALDTVTFDRHLVNDGSLLNLYSQVKQLVDEFNAFNEL